MKTIFTDVNAQIIKTVRHLKVEISLEVSDGEESAEITFDILYTNTLEDGNTFTGYKYDDNEYHVAGDPDAYDPEDDLIDYICNDLASEFTDKEAVAGVLHKIKERIIDIKKVHKMQE